MARVRCYTVDVDGVPVVVHGDGRPLTDQDMAALRELLAACRARAAAEPAEVKEARAERQRVAIERVRRNAGLTN